MKKSLFIADVVALVFAVLPVSSAHAGAEAKCKACHKFTTENSVDPGLQGIVGRKAELGIF